MKSSILQIVSRAITITKRQTKNEYRKANMTYIDEMNAKRHSLLSCSNGCIGSDEFTPKNKGCKCKCHSYLRRVFSQELTEEEFENE